MLAKANLAFTYTDLGRCIEAEKLWIQVLDVSSQILGVEHPDTMRAMRNLAAIQKTMSQTIKMNNADNHISNTSHKASMTQGIEGGNVNNRVLGEEDSDAAEPPANLPSIAIVHDTMIHSENQGIWLAFCLLLLIFNAYIPSSPLFQYWEDNFKSSCCLGFMRREIRLLLITPHAISTSMSFYSDT